MDVAPASSSSLERFAKIRSTRVERRKEYLRGEKRRVESRLEDVRARQRHVRDELRRKLGQDHADRADSAYTEVVRLFERTLGALDAAYNRIDGTKCRVQEVPLPALIEFT